MARLLIATTLLVLGGSPVWSETVKPVSATDLATYTGADRERVLFEGAKREGKVVWYTTLAADQNKQIAAAFEKKYPGVSVEIYRTGASALAQRLLIEAKASAPHRRCCRNHASRVDDIPRQPIALALYLAVSSGISR
jgi:ABC-type glycerol-3-phosphate transport system substrate-binding protein